MGVNEIEKAITQLSINEVTMLMDWLESYQEKLWDKQIEKDIEDGRLDAILAEANEEYEAGLGLPL